MVSDFLSSAKSQFAYYKKLGDATFNQLSEDQLFHKYDAPSNSIANIVMHMHGNMLSRWTDFLTTDGEKPWRHRDREFEDPLVNKAALLQRWEEGWACLFQALNSLRESDFAKVIYIRNEAHSVVEGINRQLAHYPYHVGQIVFIGKMLLGNQWESLSIPKGKSADYNISMLTNPKKQF
ncbi:DUF1572 domain-containing protein [Sphingobacterium corticibacter]|uniref:DUF1572 domain-containing protein n=1 Tax=Sphingobacterium corticibacter TaxID=2171749 RepID=A0A2T8HMU0_9SPHI|nr:DUF1572 domain-containing protein [Sphingobacterium corticibacter]PVH26723.1 hypothetical protein DC487_03705 [Sphingobacterium corticibacter]